MNKERPLLHFDPENSYIYHIGIALLPLILYGFYKNGLLPFLNQDASFFIMIKPIFMPLCMMGIGALVDYLFFLKSNQKTIWTHMPLFGLLIGMALPINANIFLTSILLFALLYGIRFLAMKIHHQISPLFLTISILLLLLTFVGGVNFLNSTESTHTLLYNIPDIFFGRSVGGISSTSIFWMLISFGYLCFDYYYKKEIPVTILGTYFLLTILFELFLPSGDLLKSLLNPTVFFGSIFIACEMRYSPYSNTGKILYSILIGVLGFFLLKFMNASVGFFLAITIVSLFVPIIDEMCLKISKKNDKFRRMPKFKMENMSFKKNKKKEIV